MFKIFYKMHLIKIAQSSAIDVQLFLYSFIFKVIALLNLTIRENTFGDAPTCSINFRSNVLILILASKASF